MMAIKRRLGWLFSGFRFSVCFTAPQLIGIHKWLLSIDSNLHCYAITKHYTFRTTKLFKSYSIASLSYRVSVLQQILQFLLFFYWLSFFSFNIHIWFVVVGDFQIKLRRSWTSWMPTGNRHNQLFRMNEFTTRQQWKPTPQPQALTTKSLVTANL